jgi:hypothetical protein
MLLSRFQFFSYLNILISEKKTAKDSNHADSAVAQVATIVKLFCHEVLRVFSDRLTNVTGKAKNRGIYDFFKP